MGILGMNKRLWTIGLSVCLLIGVLVLPGCKKKEEAAQKTVSKHDSLELLSELKSKTEEAKFHLQGELSEYDGKKYLYNSFHDEMRDFVKALSEVDMEYVDDWDPGKLEYPVYGFSLQASDASAGGDTRIFFDACWSDGFLITASGDVLKCDVDFEKLSEGLGERSDMGYCGQSMRVFNRVSAFWNGKWNKKNMMKLEDYLDDRFTSSGMTVNKADGWSAEFKSFATGNITVTLKNDSAPGLIYGNGYAHVFKKIDGTWYLVPEDPNLKHVYFTALGYVLHTGESVDLELVCGELPKGDYALLVDLNTGDTGCFEYTMAEFTV